jgi:glucokinase
MKKFAVGADIGGSHITCALIDLDEESILKHTYATQIIDNQAGANEILGTWIVALRASISHIDIGQLAGIGFAMPGPFEYDKGIARFTHEVAKYEKLNGINVATVIKELLALPANIEVRFMNDASAFAVGESWLGKASGVKRSMSVTFGTGFGSAFIDRGFPVVEREDVPEMGCVWHLKFRDGIADDYFSTRWFIKQYAAKTGIILAGVKEIAALGASDGHAKDTFMEFGLNLGEFIGPWLNKFNAGAMVIGGNVSSAYPQFGDFFENSLKEQDVFTKIEISELKEDASLIGAARMFDPFYWDKLKPLLSKM